MAASRFGSLPQPVVGGGPAPATHDGDARQAFANSGVLSQALTRPVRLARLRNLPLRFQGVFAETDRLTAS